MARILHILSTSSFSGAENIAITIIKNMICDHESGYVSLDGYIREIINSNDIYFIPVKKISILEIRRVVKIFDPDIVHAHDFTASVICAFACIKPPVISHLHHNPEWLKKINTLTILYLFSTPRYKKILIVSEAIINEYMFGNMIRNKVVSISNPLDFNSILTKANAKLYKDARYDIVFLGRLTPVKDPIRLINIIRAVKNNKNDLKVAFVGDGELRKECEEICNTSGLSENVDFLGFLDNPYPVLKASKVLCMTSKREGFGLAAIEALILGVPVVATPVGGLLDIVDEECGALTDDDEIYADEVTELISDDEKRDKKSYGAQKKAKELDSLKFYMENLTDIYREVTDKWRTRL